MSRLLRLAGWVGVAGALAALPASSQAPVPDLAKSVRVLYPAGRGACPEGPLRVVVAAPLATKTVAATLDGKPLPLERMTFAETWALPGKLKSTAARVGDRAAAALWVASPTLAAGRHTLVVAGQKLELLGTKAKAAPPAGWTQQYAHSRVGAAAGKPDCSGCHQTEDGFGGVPTPAACEGCHDEANVQLIHRHVASPLSRCAMCHDPHGASRPKLLVDAKEKLCSRCHESGHSKE